MSHVNILYCNGSITNLVRYLLDIRAELRWLDEHTFTSSHGDHDLQFQKASNFQQFFKRKAAFRAKERISIPLTRMAEEPKRMAWTVSSKSEAHWLMLTIMDAVPLPEKNERKRRVSLQLRKGTISFLPLLQETQKSGKNQ